MIDDLDKYRIEIFKIAGFAFLSPLGRIFFEPFAVYKECGPLLFCGFFITAIGLGTIGLMFILKGYDILIQRRKIK